ncbi:hypothetical protein SAMN05421763_103274 [[Luteovulum] sphaeroides subsp. megalophilum]|nr:hypothetical protein [Cereibacter sphaeroides]SNS86717.1 hypothetical protein SAMN05421763_103274 [[Luteovulum] sphaeroides subsp. megalophilum]
MTTALPSAGGSYTREADGSLRPSATEDAPAPPPVKPAVKRPVKDA